LYCLHEVSCLTTCPQEKNATEREKLGKSSAEIEAVAEMLRDVSTLSRDASIDITHAAMISLSDTANLLETSALKMVRTITLNHFRSKAEQR
jgi:hypothetical protein